MSVQYMEKVYDFCSPVYDLVFGRVFQSGREMVPSLLKLFPGASLLEVGVGTGLSVQYLPKTIDITGIDLSRKMLDKARKRLKKTDRSDVDLIKMDATCLDFPDNRFDRVLAAYFVSTVPDAVAVVEEMKRVCKPGGCLLFLNHFKSDNPVVGVIDEVLSPFSYRIGFKMNLDLYKLLQDTDLEIDVLEKIDFQGQWKAVRCINP